MLNYKFFDHAIWLVGFRPLFTLGIVSGALLPMIWLISFAGFSILPKMEIGLLQWHAHEMFFGFGWAILGGFLLTASKNWVKIRGLFGAGLVFVTLLWVIERGLIVFDQTLPFWPRMILMNAFVIAVGGYVIWSLIRYRKDDSFSDNYFFIIGLPLFLIAKNLILFSNTYAIGAAMALGLFRLAFAVMFERTMTQFMKNAMGVDLLRKPVLDFSIKGLILLGVFQALLPELLAVVVLSLAATLLLIRFFFWYPALGFRRFEIAVMYIGYLGLVAHLYLEALRISGAYVAIGTLSTHTFSFLCMGLIIPAMIVRISQGHTGRKLTFELTDRAALWSMLLAAFFRLVATQLWPDSYLLWLGLAGVGWTTCFLLIGIRHIPYLFQPRVDGRVH